MLLDKTDKARDALRAGSAAGLGLRDRRILILTDGRRSLNDVMALLGTDILPAIDRLLREGYIARIEAAAPAAPGGAMGGLIRAATEAVQTRTGQVRAAAAPSVTQPAAPAAPAEAIAPAGTPGAGGSRRSLAASKMYMLDMLQLQRSADAAELRTMIQCATDPEALVDALLQALRLIVAVGTPSYGERVARRLAEILPQTALPRLEAMRTGRSGPPALSVVA